MASIQNAAAFLRSSVRQNADRDPPEKVLLTALARLKVIPLPEVPQLLGMSPEHAAATVDVLRGRGMVEVLERNDQPGARFLRAK